MTTSTTTQQSANIPPLDASSVLRVAAENASDVDRDGRFPHEALAAMRAAGLLSCSLPTEFGGRDTSITELCAIARQIGAACSSAAMVFTMHHSQALTLRYHATGGESAALLREVAGNELLLASATTEILVGGDTSTSSCAVTPDGDEVVLEKTAPVISYGAYADYILATARRTPDSPSSDQVIIACSRNDTELKQIGDWNVVGFRGTCSCGFSIRTRTSPSNVLPDDYATISSHTMVPASHTLWASAWLGITDAAMSKARKQVRAAARKAKDSQPTPAAVKFAELTIAHQRFIAVVDHEIKRYEDFLARSDSDAPMSFTLAMNNLKIDSSTMVVDLVIGALQVCGINGYRVDHELSMDRLLRDSFAPQLMVSNDRIRANNAQLVLTYRP